MEDVALLLQAMPLYLPCTAALLALCLHWVRELRVLLVALLLSVLINVVLKVVCNQPRPPGACNCGHVPSCGHPGPPRWPHTLAMPSGHAQLGATAAAVLLLAACSRPAGHPCVVPLAALVAAALACAAAVSRTGAAARWGLAPLGRPNPGGCHTWAQAAAGSVVGALVGWGAWRVLALGA